LLHAVEESRGIDPKPSTGPALDTPNAQKISPQRRTIEIDENNVQITSAAGTQIDHKQTKPVIKFIPIAMELTPQPLCRAVKL